MTCERSGGVRQNYREILQIIMEMVEKETSQLTVRENTTVRKLRNLQRIEHRLSNLEDSLNGNE